MLLNFLLVKFSDDECITMNLISKAIFEILLPLKHHVNVTKYICGGIVGSKTRFETEAN